MKNAQFLKILLTLFVFGSTFSVSYAQKQKTLDSLKNVVNNTDRAKNFNAITALYFNISLDSALKYANKSVAYAAKSQEYNQLATAYNYLGQIMYFKANYTLALKNFEQFKTIAIKANNKELIVQAINNAANVLIDLGKTNEVIQKYEEVLALSIKYNDPKGQSLGYGNLAYIYRFIGDNDKAITYLFKQIEIDEKIKNTYGLAFAFQQLALLYSQKKDLINTKKYLDLSLNNFKTISDERGIAVIYDIFATYYLKVGNLKKAVEYEKMAISLADKLKDKRSLAIFESAIANFYYQDKLYEQAENSYKTTISLHEKINLQKTIAAAYIGYGKTLLKLNKVEQAKVNFDKALKIAISQKSAADKINVYEGLTAYYIKINQPDEALKMQQQFISTKDSLLNETNNTQLNELNTKYETEKKQNQITLLGKQNQIQVLQLNKDKFEILNKNLILDKNNLQINTQNLLLEKSHTALKQKKLETIAKEQKIKILNSQNEIQKLSLLKRNVTIAIIAGILFFSLLIGFLFYNRYKLKQEKRLQTEVMLQQDLATKAVLSAEENERKRISGELHDGLGQMFSAVKMNLSALTENVAFKDEHSHQMFHKTLGLVDESCKEVRVISHQMAPNVLLKSGLGGAVRDFINNIDSRKLKINLETFGLQERLAQNVETVLYRVIQETVNNVIKHANANTLDIQLTKDIDGINAMIEDNGKGFDTTEITNFDGIGLKNIQTRVAFLKGTVDFSSTPGFGTLVAIHIPL